MERFWMFSQAFFWEQLQLDGFSRTSREDWTANPFRDFTHYVKTLLRVVNFDRDRDAHYLEQFWESSQIIFLWNWYEMIFPKRPSSAYPFQDFTPHAKTLLRVVRILQDRDAHYIEQFWVFSQWFFYKNWNEMGFAGHPERSWQDILLRISRITWKLYSE